MSDHDPIFIDQFGTGRGGGSGGGHNLQPEDGQFWKLAWQGRVDLWKVFWVYFVFGHGILLGVGCGLMIFGLLIGFATDPASTHAGLSGMMVSATIISIVFLPFAVWCIVSVWRCADNCTFKNRGVWARVIIVGYTTALILPAVDYVWS